jgi:hypothetical protein
MVYITHFSWFYPVCLGNLILAHHSYFLGGLGSVVGIATGYGLDGPGIESWWVRNVPHLSRPVLGSTQPPVQWVLGLSWGVRSGWGMTLTPHPCLMPWSCKGRAIPLLPLRAVQPVQSLSACTRVHFTFTYNYFHTLLTSLIFSCVFYFRLVSGTCYMTLMAG